MSRDYLDRYQYFLADGKFKIVPGIEIPIKGSDKYIQYKSGKDRLDKLSQEYLNDVIKELNAIHLNSDNADIDLCCGIKCKLFVQGRGNYSKLIKLIRNYLNLETIECEEALKIDIK